MKGMTGGCLCGRVRYTINAEPVHSGICHCQHCQRYTGSAFEPFMIFPRNALAWKGALTPFGLRSDRGGMVFCQFRPNCGSGVINTSETDPGIVVVLVGTLDDPSSFDPTVELFCGRAQAWLRLDGQRQRFPGMPS
jgi:hypothetical protein